MATFMLAVKNMIGRAGIDEHMDLLFFIIRIMYFDSLSPFS